MENKPRTELIELCKAKKLTGYSNKSKKDLISLLTNNENISQITNKKTKKANGQYFTEAESLQNWIFEKTKYKQEELLEPSFGA
jgi:hypothetical protein